MGGKSSKPDVLAAGGHSETEGDISYFNCAVKGKYSSLESQDENRVKLIKQGLTKAKLINLKFTHVKGFAKNAVVDEAYLNYEKDLVKKLREDKVEVIAWDGDNYGEKSFTRVLCTIQKEIPKMKFCAFLQEYNVKSREDSHLGFDASWTGRLKDLTCILVDHTIVQNDKYDHLGVIALKGTDCKISYCFGGGETCWNEYQKAKEFGVDFKLYDTVQMKNDKPMHSPLCKLNSK